MTRQPRRWAMILAIALCGGTVHGAGGGEFQRGDANYSGSIDLSDAIFLLQYLFIGGEAPICGGVSDVNSRDGTDIADPIFLLQVLFSGEGTIAPMTPSEAEACDQGVVVRDGRNVFRAPDLAGNGMSCATCHGVGPGDASPGASGPVRPAHGLGDAANRPHWHGGAVVDLRSAVNRCRDDWMEASPLAVDDPYWTSLAAYLASLAQSAEPAPPLVTDAVPPTMSGPGDGDPVRGCEVFHRACSACHGEDGAGTETLGPSLWTTIYTQDEIRSRVRLSGPTSSLVPGTLWEGLLGNRMPFFAPDRLGDEDLEDIVAYMGVAIDPRRRSCDDVAVEPVALLRAGSFQTILHGVRGRAEHWSDRTIRLRNFFYDGNGPEFVLVWLYDHERGDPHRILRGYRISDHMARPRPYAGEDLEFAIPDEVTDDMFDTVSIWCTAEQTNYGEARLRD